MTLAADARHVHRVTALPAGDLQSWLTNVNRGRSRTALLIERITRTTGPRQALPGLNRGPADEAVIEARVEADQEAARAEQVHNAVGKILDALRSNGYEPALRIEDVEVHGPE